MQPVEKGVESGGTAASRPVENWNDHSPQL